jgi:hypothetical protein
MKILAILTLSALSLVHAGPGHDHGGKASTLQGREVEAGDQRFEFYVREDGKVRLTFLDADDKPVAAGTQDVSLTGGDRAKPTRLAFVKEGDALVSDAALPADLLDMPVVLRVTPAPGATSAFARFQLNRKTCGECDRPEYACTCDHAH